MDDSSNIYLELRAATGMLQRVCGTLIYHGESLLAVYVQGENTCIVFN